MATRDGHPGQLGLVWDGDPREHPVAVAFDPARLTQARLLSGTSKQDLAARLNVSPAAVGQWEAGIHPPRPDHVDALAAALQVPGGFFAPGRPYARMDASAAHFRSLRATRTKDRDRAVAFVEQLWELTYALERRVELPRVDLPGRPGAPGAAAEAPLDPAAAARAVRSAWRTAPGPFPHLVRTLELHGVVVSHVAFAGEATARIDALSTSHLPRPLIITTPDRADDVFRHRFTTAHELGHLLLHQDAAPGDVQQEREANLFAAELLLPAHEIVGELPSRMRLSALDELGQRWGVAATTLITRARELGLVTDVSARRAYQRYEQVRALGAIKTEPIMTYPGETPVLLRSAFELAARHGLTVTALARELAWDTHRLRSLLGLADHRPALSLVPGS